MDGDTKVRVRRGSPHFLHFRHCQRNEKCVLAGRNAKSVRNVCQESRAKRRLADSSRSQFTSLHSTSSTHRSRVLLIFGLYLTTNIADAVLCDCEYCDEERVIGLGVKTTTPAWRVMYKEDSDDDGNWTICASNRDFNNRTFPSICHMLCYNHCTRYRAVKVEENDTKKYVLVAYRPNYYKLKDGPC